MVSEIAILEQALDAGAIRRALANPRAGAFVLFEGTARDHHEGRTVDALSYEAFLPMAETALDRIRKEALARFKLAGCIIHHRIGDVPIGEAAVVVACASAHRREAFEAAAWIMDGIKEQVPIWKRERYREGDSAWVEGEKRP